MEKPSIQSIKRLNRQVHTLEELTRDLFKHNRRDEMLTAINKITSNYQEIQHFMATHDLNAIWKRKLTERIAIIESTTRFAAYAYNPRAKFRKDLLNVPQEIVADCEKRYVDHIKACLFSYGLSKKRRRNICGAIEAALKNRVCSSGSIMDQATANSILIGNGKAREWLMTIGNSDESDIQISGANFCPGFKEFAAQAYFPKQKTEEMGFNLMNEDQAAREQLHTDLRAAIAEVRSGITQVETSSAYNADEYLPQDLVAISSGTLDSGEWFFD